MNSTEIATGSIQTQRVGMGDPMTAPDQDWWSRARKARDELVYLVLAFPDVLLIDIGQDPFGISPTPVLRIHIRPRGTAKFQVPEVVGDIPIRVIQGNYHLR